MRLLRSMNRGDRCATLHWVDGRARQYHRSDDVSTTLLNIGIVLALILVEGIFVAAEISLVTLREGQVSALAERGRRGVAVARLVGDPNRFLATVQIGVTSTALLSSAFGAVTLSEEAKRFLVDHGLGRGWAATIGIVGVTFIISMVTLIVGELAPKRLGLQRAEGTASALGPTLDRLATLARPLIWFLSRATDVMVRLLGGDPNAGREAISDEELRSLVAAHESLSSEERRLIDEVFAASERSVAEVMVPRPEVEFLEAALTISRAMKTVGEFPHSRYPVIGRNRDDVIGFVHIRDLVLGDGQTDRTRRVSDHLREVKALPGSKKVLAALSEMRREGHHLAIVVDEYGGTDGIVTLEDLIEEVIGDIRDEYDVQGDQTRRLASGEVEVDARINLDEFTELTGLRLPSGPYETAGGWVMAQLGRLPVVGDVVDGAGMRIVVTAVDGRRTSRVRVIAVPDPAQPSVTASAADAGSDRAGS
jgi:putative hemolysin